MSHSQSSLSPQWPCVMVVPALLTNIVSMSTHPMLAILYMAKAKWYRKTDYEKIDLAFKSVLMILWLLVAGLSIILTSVIPRYPHHLKETAIQIFFSVSENSCNVILLSHLIYIPGIILLCLFFLLFLGLIVLVIIQLASANSIQEMPSQEWNLDNLDEMTTKIRKRNWRGLGLRSIWPSRRSPVVEPQSKCSVCSNLLSPIEESCSKCQEQYNRLSQVLPGSVLSGDSFDLICRRNVSYYISSHAYCLF